MNFIKSFLAQNEDLGRAIMVVAVFVVTFLFGMGVKYFTKKIKDENTRKSLNSVLYYLAIGLGFLTEYIYAKVAGTPFRADYGLVLGACSVGTNEGIKIIGYYVRLVLSKIKTGEKLTEEELLKPLPKELLGEQDKGESETAEKTEEEKVAEEKEAKATDEKETDLVAKAQEEFENLLK